MKNNGVRSKLIVILKKTIKLIDSNEYKEASKMEPQDFTRNRKLPFSQLIRFMLARTKGSTQNALEKYFDKLGSDIFMSRQAFGEARAKVKASAFSTLFYMTAGTAYDGYYNKWRGYRVSAIDGSKIALPDTTTLGNYYGTMGANSSSPTAQASIMYDILNKVVVDALIEPLSVDERTLALRHIDNLDKSLRLKKELVIMDRGYPSYELVAELLRKNIHFLMRVKRGFNKDIDARTKTHGLVRLCKDGCLDILVRVVKLELPSGETEALITSLRQSDLTAEDFRELYFMRWPVETKFDEVKNKLELENFTGTTVLAIKQDFYATMYLTNVAATAWWEAQEEADAKREGKNNKYRYVVNVNHEIGVLKDRLVLALTFDDPADINKEIEKILFSLAKSVSAVRPGRSSNRNKSVRKSKFHFNHRSNS